MRENIKKILREFTENLLENNDLSQKADYMQKIAQKKSKYPSQTKKISYMLDKIQKDVKSAYRDVTGEEPVNDGNIIVTVDDNIKVGKIGSFTHPTNKEDLGVMKIHPKALENIDYTEDVLKHETIHSVCGLDPKCRKHKGIFQPIANKVKLPNEYRH